MEDIEREVSSSGNSFMNHMLKFDVDTKTELLNCWTIFFVIINTISIINTFH